MTDDDEPFEPEPLEIPIDGELDLHNFPPREVSDIVRAYLEECRERGILEVRLVHGKGTGQLRRTVRSVLAKLDYVRAVREGGMGGGGWGATLVDLEPTRPRPDQIAD